MVATPTRKAVVIFMTLLLWLPRISAHATIVWRDCAPSGPWRQRPAANHRVPLPGSRRACYHLGQAEKLLWNAVSNNQIAIGAARNQPTIRGRSIARLR
jgi:hypothetical protein